MSSYFSANKQSVIENIWEGLQNFMYLTITIYSNEGGRVDGL